MTTDQKYDGKESHANSLDSIEPTAENSPLAAQIANSGPSTDEVSNLRELVTVQRELIKSKTYRIDLLEERNDLLKRQITLLETAAPLSPAISPDDSVSIYADCYEAQERLLDVVDEYLQTVSPVSAINNLLEYWLTTPPVDLSNTVNYRQLHTVLQLINFLVMLKDCDDALKLVTDERRKEVSHA